MLITRPNIRIITKEVTLESGEKALAYFVIREISGVIECKFLGTKIIAASPREEVLLLSAPEKVVWAESPIRTIYERLSPYFSLDFLVNQLARAPSVR